LLLHVGIPDAFTISMTLTNHAIKRIIERNKAASFMTPKQLTSLANSAEIINDGHIKYLIMKSIDIVLVLNTSNDQVLTTYRFSNSKFNERPTQ
jgi:hypothetical protein